MELLSFDPFYIRKVLGTLVLPPIGPLVLAFAGLLLIRRHPKLGGALAWLGLTTLLLLSIPIVSSCLLKTLDDSPPLDFNEARTAQVIVIPGGGIRQDAPEFGGDTVGQLSLERVRYGAWIARRTGLPVLVTGGAVYGGTAEADAMRKTLVDEFSVEVKWAETQSRNTHENALRSAELLHANAVSRVILVAHAFDMRRFRAEFEAAGLRVVPAPTMIFDLTFDGPHDLVPNSRAFLSSYYALYELLGKRRVVPRHVITTHNQTTDELVCHSEQRKKLRALLAGAKCLLPASIYDPISARIAESVGYELGLLVGSVVASTTLAAPDLLVHTLTEYADLIRRIMRVSRLSLFVDADNGYGNALNVMRTVQEFEHAGVSGLAIEDTVGPISFAHTKSEDSPNGRQKRDGVAAQRLISIEEAVGKMRAAVAARSDPSLVIAARTPALKIEGIEGMIARVRAYAASGVDAIHIPGGPQKLDHFRAIQAAANLPLIVGRSHILLNREELAASGARIILPGHQAVNAAAKALRETYSHLFNGGAPADLKSNIASALEMEQLMNGESYKQFLREYMR